MKTFSTAVLGGLFLASGAMAQQATTATAPAASAPFVNPDVGVPVFPYDLTDKPYRVLGEVKAGVRKATVFSKSPSQEKIYKELWERGRKLGADAVINAKYGDAHVTAFSWGKANATGTAVKFLAPGEASPAAPAAK
ncbi:hypothetical protein EV292_11086 [Sphingomonas sp. BK235]|nr:hypothetical protein EV292_11086 [Sphingomonas sp. BK235]